MFNSKYVLYVKADAKSQKDDERNNPSINNATMISACDHYLMASAQLLAKYDNIFTKLGITEGAIGVADPITTFNTYMDSTRESHLNNNMLLNQDPVDFVLRDYAIAAKIPTICVGLLSDDPGTSQREIVASKMKPNSPIFG
ncbi:MAG: hypothetical protein MJ201_01215 [Mycoplasmoidaceae bacterium]|nr:hypothetical protein [Mycoplasmoidaceae bacterium]